MGREVGGKIGPLEVFTTKFNFIYVDNLEPKPFLPQDMVPIASLLFTLEPEVQ